MDYPKFKTESTANAKSAPGRVFDDLLRICTKLEENEFRMYRSQQPLTGQFRRLMEPELSCGRQREHDPVPRHREVAAMYANDGSELTCFNCEEVGHLIRHCPYPRNPRIRCYRCGHLDVITRDCPNCSPRQGEGPNYGGSRPGGGQSRTERHRDDQRNYPNDNRAESGRNRTNGGRSERDRNHHNDNRSEGRNQSNGNRPSTVNRTNSFDGPRSEQNTNARSESGNAGHSDQRGERPSQYR